MTFGMGLVMDVSSAPDPPLPQVCARGSAFQGTAVVQRALSDGLRFGLWPLFATILAFVFHVFFKIAELWFRFF